MFGAAKEHWKSCVSAWKEDNKDKTLDEIEFVRVWKAANKKFIKIDSIKNAFRKTGIFPFNVENVDFTRCYGTDRELQQESLPVDVVPFDGSVEVFEPENIISESIQVNDETFILQTAELDQFELLNLIGKNVEALKSRFSGGNTVLESAISVLQHQLEHIKTVIASEATSSSATASASTPKTISDILLPPQKFIRSSKPRNFKVPNYGVMTSDESLNAEKSVLDEKAAAQAKKNEKSAKILQTKPSKSLDTSPKPVPIAPVKKRGRPKKIKEEKMDNAIDEESVEKMKQFVNKSKLREKKREERKQELTNYEMKHCTDMSNDELKL